MMVLLRRSVSPWSRIHRVVSFSTSRSSRDAKDGARDGQEDETFFPEEYVEEENKYVSSQQIFDGLVYHPKKKLSAAQQRIHAADFKIPEELKDVNEELKWYKENRVKDLQPRGYDPTEHTLMRLLFGNALKEKEAEIPRDLKKTLDPDFDLNLKPLSEVARQLESLEVKSNVLKLKRRDSLLVEEDFKRIYPPKLERQYELEELSFEMVRGRFGNTLFTTGVIYLVFPDFLQAGCYYLETLDKQLNGQFLQLEFVDVDAELEFISPPTIPNLKASRYLAVKDSKAKPDIQDLSKYLAHHRREAVQAQARPGQQQQRQQQQRAQQEDGPPESTEGKLFKHTPLRLQMSTSREIDRSQICFFKRLPRHMTVAELESVLWDYDLFDLEEFSIRHVTPGFWMVVFATVGDRDRCIRQFDNRHWYDEPHMPLVTVEPY